MTFPLINTRPTNIMQAMHNIDFAHISTRKDVEAALSETVKVQYFCPHKPAKTTCQKSMSHDVGRVEQSEFTLHPPLPEAEVTSSIGKDQQWEAGLLLAWSQLFSTPPPYRPVQSPGEMQFLLTNLVRDENSKRFRWRINIDVLVKVIPSLAPFPGMGARSNSGDTLFVYGTKSSYVKVCRSNPWL